MSMDTAPVSASQRQRWHRSAWHRLLVAIDARASASGRIPTAQLLGVSAERLAGWLDTKEAMPMEVQRLLIGVAHLHFRDDQRLLRVAERLRAQLDATAAFMQRGPLHTSLTPEEVRYDAAASS